MRGADDSAAGRVIDTVQRIVVYRRAPSRKPAADSRTEEARERIDEMLTGVAHTKRIHRSPGHPTCTIFSLLSVGITALRFPGQ